MRITRSQLVTVGLAVGLGACIQKPTTGSSQGSVIVTIQNQNGGGGDQVDLATCGTPNSANNGTALISTNVTASGVTCIGDTGGSVSITGDLETTASATFADAFLVFDDASGTQVSASLLEVVGTTGNSNHPGTGWTFDSQRQKFIYGWSYSVTLPNGTSNLQICFAQNGAGGRPEKCTCTDIITINVNCAPDMSGGGGNACLARTRGFWGTHPAITAQFLPITVCGAALTQTAAGSCHSSSEALCTSLGTEWHGDPQAGQLIAQLTTAELNVAATNANGGNCGGDVNALIARCTALCYADGATIGNSGCIDDLDAFNNSMSTITPPPFDNPGPASPKQCQQANGNGVIVTQSCP